MDFMSKLDICYCQDLRHLMKYGGRACSRYKRLTLQQIEWITKLQPNHNPHRHSPLILCINLLPSNPRYDGPGVETTFQHLSCVK